MANPTGRSPQPSRQLQSHDRCAMNAAIAFSSSVGATYASSAMRSLANSLLANAETRIIYRQEADQLGTTAQALGLTGTEQSLLPGLGTGQGLWRIKERSFVVQHQLHPDELTTFDTTTRMTGGKK